MPRYTVTRTRRFRITDEVSVEAPDTYTAHVAAMQVHTEVPAHLLEDEPTLYETDDIEEETSREGSGEGQL